MSHVLIWRRMNQGSELDIFHPTDYSKLYDHVMNEWNGQRQNWGNRLWFQGIYSALDNGENTYDFLQDPVDIEKINSEYDFIILSLANVFCTEYLDGLRRYADIFEKVNIPVFVIACGVQADSYDELDNIVKLIGEDSKRFIRAIYNTGGEFALRGYFTKMFFDKLGFNSAVVTGCPSLFQFGPDFMIDHKKVDHNILSPVFNGHIKPYTKLMKEYPKSFFMDQDEFFYPLYQPNYLNDIDLKFKLNFINRYGIDTASMLAKSRICMIADTNEWWNYLKDQEFNYSFGSRIHGTIMAILSGIPSTIVACDSRTREMAEYFDIPMLISDEKHFFSKQELWDAYAKMDYSKFNAEFKKRFDIYEQFFVNHGIVSCINRNNKFLVREYEKSYDFLSDRSQNDFEKFYADLSRNELYLSIMNKLLKVGRRILR